jgi:hypothetical protein
VGLASTGRESRLVALLLIGTRSGFTQSRAYPH